MLRNMLIIVVMRFGAAGLSAHPAGATAVSQSIDHLMMIWTILMRVEHKKNRCEKGDMRRENEQEKRWNTRVN